MIRRRRRPGVSLTEALVAMFIVALALTSLLALLPLGVMRMGQAFKDGRTGQLANSSDCYARLWWKDLWLDPATDGLVKEEVITGYDPDTGAPTPASPGPPPIPPPPPGKEHALRAFDNPNAPWYPSPSDPVVPPNPAEYQYSAGAYGGSPFPQDTTLVPRFKYSSAASYPIFLDPVGFVANHKAWMNGDATKRTAKWWVGGANGFGVLSNGAGLGVPRRSLAALTYIPAPAQLPATALQDQDQYYMRLRLFSLLDDIGFKRNADGNPANGYMGAPDLTNGSVQRGGVYNCAWLIQRPNNNKRFYARINVVVYEKRSSEKPSEESVAFTPAAFPIHPDPNNPSPSIIIGPVTVNGTQQRPPIRKTGWIMVVSGPQFPNGAPEPVAEFYRVIGINDDGAPNSYRLELQSPIRPVAGSLVDYSAAVVFMDNVVEVFDEQIMGPLAEPIR
jgi:hypothetical protein